ncbi:MAG: hypothetical protein IPK13_13800 [Deltaproteobacteria bacterium]|nr:hypothetical protein [Deltaproteobacteria bacterium]
MDTLFFHPKVVHVPIALGVLMPLLAGGVLLAWWRQWLPARSWVLVVALQGILLGSGIVALQTGESEETRVERVVPEHAIEEHEEAAEVFVWACGVVLGLMLLGLAVRRSRVGLPTAAVATLGTLAVLGLGYRTGQAGGDLVYRHNAASAYTNSAQGSTGSPEQAPNRRAGEEHDDDDD